jgi:formylglycine-generating enzyme required for sulfatase activity
MKTSVAILLFGLLMAFFAGCDSGGGTPPTISTQPSNQTVTAGQTATFTVTATGTVPLWCQWQKSTDGGITWNEVLGATAASYTTPATTLADSGEVFRCVVTNPAGNVISNTATLTCNPVPVAGQYIIIDLSGGTQAISYPYTTQAGPPADLLTNTAGPGSNNIYKTTHLVLAPISAGTFTMGSPTTEIGRQLWETQHQVTLAQDFYMGVFDVTQEQYLLVTGLSPSQFSGDPANPVDSVTWNDVRGADANWPNGTQRPDATTFLGLISTKTGLAFDLPTEAQWEYACRAGTTTALNSGQNLASGTQDAAADAVAWYANNSGNQTHPVGSKPVNTWGLYDMHGNVLEWCLDWWDGSDYTATPATDPLGQGTGPYRVLRGGSWFSYASLIRSASRFSRTPGSGRSDFGFRVVVPGP